VSAKRERAADDPGRQPGKFAKAYGKYMFVVGIGGNLFFYVQAFEIYKKQSAHDVSLLASVVAFWAVSSWCGYGLVLKNWVLISANIVAMIGAALVILGKLVYGM